MNTEREPQNDKTEVSPQGSSQEDTEQLPDPNVVDLTEGEDSSDKQSSDMGSGTSDQEELPPPNVAIKGRDPELKERKE